MTVAVGGKLVACRGEVARMICAAHELALMPAPSIPGTAGTLSVLAYLNTSSR